MHSVELFAGAGGLAMGLTQAGFRHLAVVEWDRYACHTLRENQRRQHSLVTDWKLAESDVREFDFSALPEGIELVAGGPPCQPFSMGGKHGGYLDPRDMFPQAVRAVHELKPLAFVFENVRGLARPAFFNYFQYVQLQLKYPEIRLRKHETWETHYKRLQEYEFSGKPSGLHYMVHAKVLNAANYGIPQRRERVFIVGFRADLEIEWSYPQESHSMDALYFKQWVDQTYWERHKVPKAQRLAVPAKAKRLVERLRSDGLSDDKAPWRTVRDAIGDLPNPRSRFDTRAFPDHRYQPGARTYPGHTGSPMDEPAKTLKAGDHGVPGGENMLRYRNAQVRYFTVRESARLQTFPDDFRFYNSWTETMRQLGNAVPVDLGALIGRSVANRLSSRVV